MKYMVTVNDAQIVVDLDGENVRVGSESMRARLAEADESPERILTIGDEIHRVFVRPGDTRGRYTLWVDGFRFEVEALDERSRAIRELSAAASAPKGPAPLVAPMPGMIVRINVNEGDVVKPGQGLVVMEAMKMENELRATTGGAVRRVLVAPGTAVEKGALLLEME
ncbi:MAG TPA: acetyl-CoA carboxylase biotin carboxyl carrier protein subunit [Gemmatimonadaceae bacterium]|nr:acetyl-CoA carboxylase biotin carboxyl carrier protein subunit [Gemmatimonadaceae bacterium]